jgi:hypothetical protein
MTANRFGVSGTGLLFGKYRFPNRVEPGKITVDSVWKTVYIHL